MEVEQRVTGVQFSRIRKRSFKRAVKRAQLHGSTVYRGRRLLADGPVLPVQEAATVSVKPRIRFISWNVGGLSEVLFEEVKHWLNQSAQRDIGILVAQETHWDFTADWSTADWHFCHSSSGKRGSGGILVGIRCSMASGQSIRWQEIEPGRLLHVRCFLGLQQMDVVGFYQHAFLMKAGMTDQTFTQRKTLLRNLDSLLASLPTRSHVLIGGDFNATLVSESRICGHGVLTKDLNEKETEDQSRLIEVLRRHRLVTINNMGEEK